MNGFDPVVHPPSPGSSESVMTSLGVTQESAVAACPSAMDGSAGQLCEVRTEGSESFSTVSSVAVLALYPKMWSGSMYSR